MAVQTDIEVVKKTPDEKEIYSVLLRGGDDGEEPTALEDFAQTIMALSELADEEDCEVVLRVFKRPRKKRQ